MSLIHADRTAMLPRSLVVHVTVRVGDSVLESVITRRSVEEMALKKGDSVTAVVKAIEVMLSKP